MSDQIRNRLKYLKKNNLLTPEQEIKQLQADKTLLVEALFNTCMELESWSLTVDDPDSQKIIKQARDTL